MQVTTGDVHAPYSDSGCQVVQLYTRTLPVILPAPQVNEFGQQCPHACKCIDNKAIEYERVTIRLILLSISNDTNKFHIEDVINTLLGTLAAPQTNEVGHHIHAHTTLLTYTFMPWTIPFPHLAKTNPRIRSAHIPRPHIIIRESTTLQEQPAE